uniref:Disintegrin and metalloproteinase domain-containing protein 12-like protein n=2 Tax=Callorhinchus milii TaxID=7868 RepID=V9KDR3_CALMI
MLAYGVLVFVAVVWPGVRAPGAGLGGALWPSPTAVVHPVLETDSGHSTRHRLSAGDGFQWLRELHRYHGVIFPSIITRKQKWSMHLLQQNGSAGELLVSVETEEKQLILELRRNEILISKGFQVSYYDSNGTLLTEQSSDLSNCYYEGTVRGILGSRVAASTCVGLSALILLTNQSYVIEHLEEDEQGRHLMYKPEQLKSKERRCSLRHSFPEVAKNSIEHSHRLKRSLSTEVKHIELVLVADNAEYRSAFHSKRKVINRLVNAANYVDLFYRPLSIRIALIGVEVWTVDQIPVDTNALGILKRFLQWRKFNLLPRLYNDNAQLVMGNTYGNVTEQPAQFSSMCSSDYSGGIALDNTADSLGIASNLAHEIGHNLGMGHDSPAPLCVCADRKAGCIMAEIQGLQPPQVFSSCSRDSLQRSLARGVGMCLFNLPDPELLVRGKCGNLYVDPGEECDCGKPEECTDPCCVAAICQLWPGAKCASNDVCCKNCKFVKARRVCREPISECDFPEYCTGTSAHCPTNQYKKNFYPCDNGNAYCYNGACRTLQSQCRDIWGPNATPSPLICYWYMNKLGNKFGNCGRKDDGSFVSCPIKDVKCGKLQCSKRGASLILGGRSVSVVSRFSNTGKNFQCHGTYFMGDIEGIDMVASGTPCGSAKVCFKGMCRNVRVFSVNKCHAYCSGHGVCNNNDRCHCDPGWALPNCTLEGSGSNGFLFPEWPAEELRTDPSEVISRTSATTEINHKAPITRLGDDRRADTTTPELAVTGNTSDSEHDLIVRKHPRTTAAADITTFGPRVIFKGTVGHFEKTTPSLVRAFKFANRLSASSTAEPAPTLKNNSKMKAVPHRMLVTCAHTGTPIWLMVILVFILLLLIVAFLTLIFFLKKGDHMNDNTSNHSTASENDPSVRFFTQRFQLQ